MKSLLPVGTPFTLIVAAVFAAMLLVSATGWGLMVLAFFN